MTHMRNIIRTKVVAIDKELVYDASISLEALGLAIVLLTQLDNMDDVCRIRNISKESYRRCLKELNAAGYIILQGENS